MTKKYNLFNITKELGAYFLEGISATNLLPGELMEMRYKAIYSSDNLAEIAHQIKNRADTLSSLRVVSRGNSSSSIGIPTTFFHGDAVAAIPIHPTSLSKKEMAKLAKEINLALSGK